MSKGALFRSATLILEDLRPNDGLGDEHGDDHDDHSDNHDDHGDDHDDHNGLGDHHDDDHS